MNGGRGRYLAGGIYVAVSIVIAAVAAWPIYRSPSFVVLVAASSVLAGGIAALATWRRWGGWATAGLLAGVFLISGIPLAVPGRLWPPAELVRGLVELGSGAVVGWKDLLTVDLPVGSYRNLLVPALIVFLVGTTVALRMAWRKDAVAVCAVPASLAMVAFGLLFGRTEVSAPLQLGPLIVPAPVETAVGIGSLMAGVLWLSWRSRDHRERALRRAAGSSGVRLRRTSDPSGMRQRRIGRADARRLALGAGMVVVATTGAALLVPAAAQSIDRDVLRDAAGPRVELSRAVSPLAAYRLLFADGAFDEVLFTARPAEARGDTPDRLRLAVLDAYDGTVLRTDASAAGAPFVRVASGRDPGPGDEVDLEIVTGTLGALWMPSAGSLASVEFDGSRAAVLADGFYYSDELSAAVQTTPWSPGDRYRLRAVEPVLPALPEVAAPGGLEETVEVPASLRTWVQRHVAGAGGPALQGLVDLLRARGYLSHALAGADGGAEWMRDLGDYSFAPSASGHSLARVDDMFASLLEREDDPRAEASGNYIAAVGDDEQFAAAVVLIAQELGFPARVVVGTRLVSGDAGLAVCEEGACRSGDVSAWVEVRAASGQWVPVDVTPQHERAPSREVTEQPDPTIGTAVRPDTVEEVRPPRPDQEDSAPTPPREDEVDLGWLWATLRIGGSVMGIAALVAAPFLLILALKGLRRRSRRRAVGPAERIAGGWDEYLDAAVDAGRRAPASATRSEVAVLHASPAALTLARSADEAVFSAAAATADEAERFWRLVDAERASFTPGTWRRVRAALSLRSFVPVDRRSASDTERGSRGGPRPRRTA